MQLQFNHSRNPTYRHWIWYWCSGKWIYIVICEIIYDILRCIRQLDRISLVTYITYQIYILFYYDIYLNTSPWCGVVLFRLFKRSGQPNNQQTWPCLVTLCPKYCNQCQPSPEQEQELSVTSCTRTIDFSPPCNICSSYVILFAYNITWFMNTSWPHQPRSTNSPL